MHEIHRGDLRITLQSPAGTRVQLVNGDTGSIDGNNFNVRLDDDQARLLGGIYAATSAISNNIALGGEGSTIAAAPVQGKGAGLIQRIEVAGLLDEALRSLLFKATPAAEDEHA